MTDMQLIVPPLEENTNPGDDLGDGTTRTNGGTNALSDEVREQFESMKTVWRRARRSSGEEAEELKRKERDVAVETAVAIEAEMKMWQNGIAELEAMLAEEDGDEDIDRLSDEQVPLVPQQVVRFPSLPPVIPAEEEDFKCGQKQCE